MHKLVNLSSVWPDAGMVCMLSKAAVRVPLMPHCQHLRPIRSPRRILGTDDRSGSPPAHLKKGEKGLAVLAVHLKFHQCAIELHARRVLQFYQTSGIVGANCTGVTPAHTRVALQVRMGTSCAGKGRELESFL